MPFYRVNMMGGFRVPDKEQVLSEGEVYEFSEEEVAESRGLSAALRGRWMIETNKDGKPVSKAGPKQVSAASARPPAVEADMYPDSEPADDDEMARVNAEETALHFDDAGAAEDVVATPAGIVGPRAKKAKKPAKKTKKTKKSTARSRRAKRKPKKKERGA